MHLSHVLVDDLERKVLFVLKVVVEKALRGKDLLKGASPGAGRVTCILSRSRPSLSAQRAAARPIPRVLPLEELCVSSPGPHQSPLRLLPRAFR